MELEIQEKRRQIEEKKELERLQEQRRREMEEELARQKEEQLRLEKLALEKERQAKIELFWEKFKSNEITEDDLRLGSVDCSDYRFLKKFSAREVYNRTIEKQTFSWEKKFEQHDSTRFSVIFSTPYITEYHEIAKIEYNILITPDENVFEIYDYKNDIRIMISENSARQMYKAIIDSSGPTEIDLDLFWSLLVLEFKTKANTPRISEFNFALTYLINNANMWEEISGSEYQEWGLGSSHSIFIEKCRGIRGCVLYKGIKILSDGMPIYRPSKTFVVLQNSKRYITLTITNSHEINEYGDKLTLSYMKLYDANEGKLKILFENG